MKYKYDAKKKNKKISVFCISLFVVFLFSLMVLSLLLWGTDYKIGNQDYKTDYSQYSFQDIINKDLDENNTIKNIVIKQKSIEEYINKNDYTIINDLEYVIKKDRKSSLIGRHYLSFIKDNREYFIEYYYADGKLTQSEFEIKFNKSINDQNTFVIPEDNIREIERYISISNITDLMKEQHQIMKQNNQQDIESNNNYYIKLKEYTINNSISCDYLIRK